MKIKILVAYHEPFSMIYEDDIYTPIQVGKVNSQYNLPMQGDNTGENISSLNKYYCEMTAVYWAWKNLKDVDYIGLSHYRRYISDKKRKVISFKKLNFYLHHIVNIVFNHKMQYFEPSKTKNRLSLEKELIKSNKYFKNESIKDTELFIPQPYLFTYKIRELFEPVIGKQSLDLLIEIVERKYKNEYNIQKVLNSKKLYAANIFLMKKSIFENYCEFVFPILEEHFKRYDKVLNNDLSLYQRVSGYLSEILTSMYIQKLISNQHKYKTTNLILVENTKY